MKLSKEDLEFMISYLHDAVNAKREVDCGRPALAAFIPNWNEDDLLNVITCGRFLSRQSTYCYPKVPTGIANHWN